jgi:hypothetical protein
MSRAARLNRAVEDLLEAVERRQVTPADEELIALASLCLEHGAVDGWFALRRYYAARTLGVGHTTSNTHVNKGPRDR